MKSFNRRIGGQLRFAPDRANPTISVECSKGQVKQGFGFPSEQRIADSFIETFTAVLPPRCIAIPSPLRKRRPLFGTNHDPRSSKRPLARDRKNEKIQVFRLGSFVSNLKF